MASVYDIVSGQFPEFVRANHSKFVEFIETYYRWVDQQSIGSIGNVVDLDTTSTEFVQYFRSQLDKFGLLASATPFDKKYLKQIKQVYTAKGSEEALLFLLRLAFSDGDITINYPGDNVLRASDGRWYQQSFITVTREYGTLATSEVQGLTQFEIVTADSRQPIRIAQAVVVNEAQGQVIGLRLFFQRIPGVVVTPNLPIEIVRNNVVTFRGRVTLSPASIAISNPGADWIVGQVIEFPGTTIPTLLRVTKITSTGGIAGIEVVQHGYNHSNPQTLVVSPYKTRPLGTSFELTEQSIPGGKAYTLTLDDYLEGISESLVGTVSGPATGYFAEDYASDTAYSGLDVISAKYTPVTSSNQSGFQSTVTLEDWLSSRATLVLTYATLVNTKGKWLNGRGQLSNQSIRLQDNDYYQQFSYEISGSVNPQRYDTIASAIHPAGTKRFDLHKLTTVADSLPEVLISFPFKTLTFLDATAIQEQPAVKQVTKALTTDQTSVTDTTFGKTFTKYLTTDSTSIDDDAIASSSSSGPYTSETYFSEVYATELKTLTLSYS